MDQGQHSHSDQWIHPFGVSQVLGEIWDSFDLVGWLHVPASPNWHGQGCWRKGELAESSPCSGSWQLLGFLLKVSQRLVRKCWPDTAPLASLAAQILHHLGIRKPQWWSKTTFVLPSEGLPPLRLSEAWGLRLIYLFLCQEIGWCIGCHHFKVGSNSKLWVSF